MIPIRPTPPMLATMIVCTAGLLLLGSVSTVRGYPEPSMLSDAWELDFQWRQPRIIEITDAGAKANGKYFYLPYTVTNETGQDRQFIPQFTLLTDDGQLLTAGRGVRPAVFEAIDRQLKNKFLETPAQVIGRLLQGEDYARDSVAIWPLPEGEDTDELRIFIGGLSGETVAVNDPLDPQEQIILRKTRVIAFDIPGGVDASPRQPIVQTDADWVMR